MKNHTLSTGRLPAELIPDMRQFQQLFEMRPVEPQFVRVRGGGLVAIPRRQAVYGADYRFSGVTMQATATPEILIPFLAWVQNEVDSRMNGLLLNWYDGPDEYIGPHQDADRDLIENSPIVTIAFGEQRTFRVRPKGGRGFRDFPMPNGSFIAIPWSTNQNWTHEIPESRKHTGRRISLTARCFARGIVESATQNLSLALT